MTLFYVAFIGYTLLVIGVGFWSSRAARRSDEEYFRSSSFDNSKFDFTEDAVADDASLLKSHCDHVSNSASASRSRSSSSRTRWSEITIADDASDPRLSLFDGDDDEEEEDSRADDLRREDDDDDFRCDEDFPDFAFSKSSPPRDL